MADTRKLTMVFTLDNGDWFKAMKRDPKDEVEAQRAKSMWLCRKWLIHRLLSKIIIKQQRLKKHISQLLHKIFYFKFNL